MCTKIAGAVPTWSSLQVLESEVRASKNAEECPYPVDGRCPHAGTGCSGERSTHSENDEDPVSGDTLKMSSDWLSSNPPMRGWIEIVMRCFGWRAMGEIEANVETNRARYG